MKRAFAIACWKPQLSHLKQTIACAASIRDFGYLDDIVILTLDKSSVCRLCRSCENYDVKIKVVDQVFIHNKNWVNRKRKNHYQSLLDPNKHYYWSLTDYDSVIGLDSDCWVFGDVSEVFDYNGFNVWHGDVTGPVCSAMMSVKPNQNTFKEMRYLLLNSTFSFKTGWNKCGSINGLEGYENITWKFQSSDSFQGFLVYYFHILKGVFNIRHKRLGSDCIGHAGVFKDSDCYTEILRKYLGGMATM